MKILNKITNNTAIRMSFMSANINADNNTVSAVDKNALLCKL